MSSAERLFDEDPLTGTKRWFRWDDEKQAFTIRTEQNVDGLVDANKRSFNDSSKQFKGDMHRVASIPMNVYMDLKAQGILDDQKRLKAWLNDPDNRYFRTKPGRV